MSERLAGAAGRYAAALNRQVERIVALGIWLLVADVSVAVASRYLFATPLSWAEEVARYLLIWVALLAISIGFARRDHPGLDILADRLPPSARKAQVVLEALVASVLFVTLFYFGLYFVQSGAGQSALTLGITMRLPYASVPVAAAVSLVQVWLVAIARLGGPQAVEADA